MKLNTDFDSLQDGRSGNKNCDWKTKCKSAFSSCWHWLLPAASSTHGYCSRMADSADAAAHVEIYGHTHIWVYSRQYTQGMKRIICEQARDPRHAIDWFDAAAITKRMTETELLFAEYDKNKSQRGYQCPNE